MAGNVYSKNIRRTIWGSMGRYIAILSIIALGVGFFAGIKNTKASMMLTCNEYVSEYNMYDFRLLSTYGFTDDDVDKVADVDEVAEAEGSVTADFFSEDSEGNSIILRAHSITESINTLNLTEGRMPAADNECVADEHFFTSEDIGTTVRVTDENDEDTKGELEYEEYEIVGLVNSTYYMIKTERGTTSLGDGSIDAYIYAPLESFTSEYFTEMFVTSKEQGYIFSDEYADNIAAAKSPVTKAAESSAADRYEEILADAEEEIEEGQQEIDDGRAELESERASAYAQLDSAKAELDENSSKIEAGKSELKETKKTLTSQRQQVSDGIDEVNAALAQLNAAYESALSGAARSDGSSSGNSSGSDTGSGSGNVSGSDSNTTAATAAGASNAAEYEQTKASLEAQLQQLEASLEEIDSGFAQIKEKETSLEESEAQIEAGYSEYYESKATAEAEFAAAEEELEDAQEELDEAREELEDIESPEIYVYEREDNQGFGSFESNADIVDSIAKVFPVFFFLIAALVCSTTMSRMIEEERTQIGALRALGYTSGRIMLKYMIYSGSAATIGCIAGFLAGSKYFPLAIWTAYGMMFGFAPLEFYFSWPLAAISLAGALVCSMGTTYAACRGQLNNMPAEILRPKAPRAGKRILLERFGFLWKRMRFLHKVSARNIFRYKKRMIMMILGIGGCTALVLAGFGIKDSMAGIADYQYSDIERYDMMVAYSDEIDDEQRNDFETEYADILDNAALIQETSVSVKGTGETKSCNLMISDDENISKAVNFTYDDGETIAYPGSGEAMLNDKLAKTLGVEVGDKITVTYDDTETAVLTVSGIYKNYVSNYIYINADTYENEFGRSYEPSIMLVTVNDDTDVQKAAADINGFDDVAGISVVEDVKENIDDMMVSLNYIIILVIGCAGALAFIVLFNLGNINITEREREIATIEVLGFYPRETGSYVFRENLILVMMGIVVGLPGGNILHSFIMDRIVVDAIAFNTVIKGTSYLFAVIVVLLFTFIVDIILRRKLRRINMAEALKSTE